MPLYPGSCDGESCVRMSLFDSGRGCACEGWRRDCEERCQTVRICNPACPGEYADVQLCVDHCGNLSICVHRPSGDCIRRDRRCRSRCNR